jgi:glucosamine--fructose-6-phosphate aminotransferase (isomerizing)
MIRHIRHLLHSLRKEGRGWKICIGKNPKEVSSNIIILFPLYRATFNCGIAGLLTIKGAADDKDSAIIDNIRRCLETIETGTLKEQRDGNFSVESYLGGIRILKEMERHVLKAKQHASLQYTIFESEEREKLTALSQAMNRLIANEETLIAHRASSFSTGEMEQIAGYLTLLKDIAWAFEKDILSNIDRIIYLSGKRDKHALSREEFKKYRNINLLINAIDRLEVRGRDSAGVQIVFTLKDRNTLMEAQKKIRERGLYDQWKSRLVPGDLTDGSVQLADTTAEKRGPSISFTYKKASVTGKLGENGNYLRARIRNDQILHHIIDGSIESDIYLAHTRWASVGSITEGNCHPVNNFTLDTETGECDDTPFFYKEYPRYGRGSWTINVVLNGDIDNYNTLRTRLERNGREIINHNVTTDTKIITLQIEKYLYAGQDLAEAFRLALNDFEGSHAVAMESNLEPDKVFLALRGSGQSLYIGICDNQYMFSSELYGLVEVTPHFIKMDGEHERIEGKSRTRGQIFVLNSHNKERSPGIAAFYYDGYPLDVEKTGFKEAEITTRDIDRKGYDHYLLKEILEAPSSVSKTLRGKYYIHAGSVVFNLDDSVLPPSLRKALTKKLIRHIVVVGQGTAHIAAKAIAQAFSRYLAGSGVTTTAQTSSEFSGFSLREDLNDTLIIPVTQSGTTTDTNRAIALAKEHRAHVIAIVNRRQSDITHIADGVFYTSDGRDIEMSVASTKAFYSQIIAGVILVLNMAQMLGTMSERDIKDALGELEAIPAKMNKILSIRENIKKTAWDIVKQKVYWAVVGSGPNKVAADEIRIKLSELCYKTISSDIVENKKHIDLSSEPLVLVCAAGNPDPVIEDIVKDVAIFKAHKAATVVIADEGEQRFDGISDSVITIPSSPFPTPIILNTLVGHIWGYFAACSINDDGILFNDFRKKLSIRTQELQKEGASIYDKMADEGIQSIIEDFSSEFHARRNRGFFSSMSVGLISDITLLLKYTAGKLPMEDFWEEFKGKRPSSSPLDMLDISLGHTVDELARPIDAIRHQAKTVTVGTSRKGEVPRGIIFDFLGNLAFSLESLTTKDGFTTRRLQKAISSIEGYTLYAVGRGPEGVPTLSIEKRGGISLTMKSRVETPGPVKGTKKTIMNTGDIYAGMGKSDKKPIVIIPLLGEDRTIGSILLLHVVFNGNLTVSDKKEIIGNKLNSVSDLVNERNVPWRDRYLEELPIDYLLGEGDDAIANKIIKSLKKTDHVAT